MAETEGQLLNRIRRMYGIRAADETVTSTAGNEAELTRLRALLGSPEPPRNISVVDNAGRGRMAPNPAYWTWQRERDGLGQRISDLERTITGQREGPAQTQDQEADANKAALEAILGGQRGAALADGTATLDDRFTGAWRQNGQQAGAQGLAGGSADRSARRRMLADLFKGRSRLALSAETADRSARNSIDARRLELERQVKLGTAPDVGTINAVGEQRGAIDEAYKGLGQQALGDLLVQGGQTYYSGQEAAGAGRAGPSAFSLSRRKPSTTGTYLG